MASVIIENLFKQYKGGEIQALKGVNLTCDDGEFFCILGPAGAGKTLGQARLQGEAQGTRLRPYARGDRERV